MADIRSKVHELATKIGISETDISNIANYVICELLGMEAGDNVDIGDWVVTSVDGKCFYISEKYTDADMSRFLHDEFTKRQLLKTNERI